MNLLEQILQLLELIHDAVPALIQFLSLYNCLYNLLGLVNYFDLIYFLLGL